MAKKKTTKRGGGNKAPESGRRKPSKGQSSSRKTPTKSPAKKKSIAPSGSAEKAKGKPSAGADKTRLKRIDRDLLKLLNERAKIWQRLVKEADPADVAELSALRSEEALSQLVEANKGPFSGRAVRAVFREIGSGCRELVGQPRIAVLGPLHSYSHLAAIERFGQSVEFVPVSSISAVFEEVNRGHAEYGLVPVENSTDGRIADTLEMFTRLPVRICGEVQLAIHHTLLGKCPRDEIKEVYSKPQALSQCRNWLAKHLPAARPIEVTSTSTAAQLAKEKPGAGAVASLQAGIHYGLDVLAEQIEDNPNNLTRFAVIGEQSGRRTGNDKTAMMFEVEHRPGALADAMGIFKRNRLNLTWIESFPIPGGKRAYLFFIEMEGHENDARVRRATAALEKKTLRLEILGSFAATPPID
jgi:chorismate mutase/prephenate dehydratase